MELTVEALQEIQQRRTEVRGSQQDTQRMQDAAQSSAMSQREEPLIRQVEVVSVKRTRVEPEEKKPVMFKEAPMSCPIRPQTQGELERQPAFKSPPQHKAKSEGMPKAILKAPPPKVAEE